MKTARFKQVVAKCGRPQLHLPWIKPEKDPALRKAVKAQRLMTVHQALHGAAKDFGTVGLFKDGRASQVLIFAKSLRAFAERRIVGVDYGLLAADTTPQANRQTPRPTPKPEVKAAPKPVAVVNEKPTRPTHPIHAVALTPPLAKEIRAALRELKAGRTVAAHERLTRLLTD